MRHRAKPIWWIAVGLVVALARCIDTPVERQRICEATSGRCFYVANTSAHGSGSFTNPYGLPDLPSAATPYCALASPALDSLQPGDILYFFGGDYLLHTCAGPTTVYDIGYIRPPRSGTAGSRITIKAYPGETVRLVATSGDQPVLGNDRFSYVRFEGLVVEPRNGGAGGVNFHGVDTTARPVGLEIAYCEVVGSYVATVDNHDGVRLELVEAPWVHHTVIHGVRGESPNSAGIKLYQVRHAVIEDDYIHDNTAGIFDKESAVANVYRRNLLTANVQPFYGNNQADPASYELYDNVIDGEIGLHYLTNGAVIHDNLLRRDTLAGDWAGATWNSELWNNVVIGPGGQVLAYYDSHDSLSTTPPAQLAYMDYNVYGAVPTYRFGTYSSGPEQVLSLADMIIHGYEVHSAIALVSDIFVDRVSYQLKPPWQTAGRYGDGVGPDNVAEILNVGRYGPGAK